MALAALLFTLSLASAAPNCGILLESPEQLRARVTTQLSHHLAVLRADPRLEPAARLSAELRDRIESGEIEIEPVRELGPGLEFKVGHYMIDDRLEPRIEGLRISVDRLADLKLADWVAAAADIFLESEYLARRGRLSSLNFWDAHAVRARWLEALTGKVTGYGERDYARALLTSFASLAPQALVRGLMDAFGLAEYARLTEDFTKLDGLLAEPLSPERSRDLAHRLAAARFREPFLALGRAAAKAYLAEQLLAQPALAVLSDISDARAKALVALTRAELQRQLRAIESALAANHSE